MSTIHSKIQQLCATRLSEIDAEFESFVQNIRVDSISRINSDIAIMNADVIRRQQRVHAVERTVKALNLVIMTFEVAEDGDKGVGKGFAPALLDALRMVQSLFSVSSPTSCPT